MTSVLKKSKDLRLEVSGFIIERTAKRMKQSYQRMLKEQKLGITVDQWIILQELDKEDKQSQLELAQRSYKDAPTITRIIDLLCKKELLTRVSNPEDRRKFSICLSKKGKAKIKAVQPIVKKFREQCWKGLKEEDMTRLTEIMDVIFKNIER